MLELTSFHVYALHPDNYAPELIDHYTSIKSYLIQDEPGAGGRFSHKMSLEERSSMLGIDSQRATASRG